MSTTSSSSSSSNDESIVELSAVLTTTELLLHTTKNEQFSESTVNLFTEQEFRQHFRYSTGIKIIVFKFYLCIFYFKV